MPSAHFDGLKSLFRGENLGEVAGQSLGVPRRRGVPSRSSWKIANSSLYDDQ